VKLTIKRKRKKYDFIDPFFHPLIRYNPDCIVHIDLQGNIVMANPASVNLLGYSLEELKRMDVRSLIFPKKLRERYKYVSKVTLGLPQEFEDTVIHRLGHIIELSVRIFPIITDCKIIGIHIIAKEITERKRIARALIEAEQKYRSLAEESLVGVYILQDDKFVYANPWVTKVLGYSQEEILNMSPMEFCVPEDRHILAENRDKRISGKLSVSHYNLRLLSKDKRIVYTEIIVKNIIYNGRPAIMGTLIDITHMKRAEEMLRKSEKLAIAGELAAGVAHEIRNPLATLRGFVQLLSDGHNINDYLSIMLSEIDRINSIVTEFLMLAKPQASTEYVKKDIRLILNSVVYLIRSQASLNNVELICDFDTSIPLIKCEENHLKQVFINILKNAIEAMNNGGAILIQLKRSDNDVWVQVKDQGCGIPQNLLPKIGEPFYTTKEKGTGLGLMICHKIIGDHMGNIQINSIEGKGTTVDIFLPIKS
jgi:two-component system, sporulation sensor kinase A